MKHFAPIFILLICGLSAACSGKSQSQEGQSPKIIETADSPAYHLGQRHAEMMLNECRTTDEIRNRLLDLRAREHIIRTQIRQSAADAYIEGIESTVRTSGDTLASAIL